MSEPYQVMAVRFMCDKENSLDFEVSLESRFPSVRINTGIDSIFQSYGTAPNAEAKHGESYANCEHQVLDGKGIGFSCAA